MLVHVVRRLEGIGVLQATTPEQRAAWRASASASLQIAVQSLGSAIVARLIRSNEAGDPVLELGVVGFDQSSLWLGEIEGIIFHEAMA